jgi:L-threonylcarbamoyladenylate synthase
MPIAPGTDAGIRKATEVLRGGGLVAFPTETVYGLGADAENPVAVTRVFVVKGRPAGHPLIVHLGAIAQLDRWAVDIPAVAWRLAECFWPGPLTLILRRSRCVPDVVTGGQDSVGLRVPAHPVAAALLEVFGDGIAAPSANRFGRVSPTTAAHVRDELGEAVDFILDGGPCAVGIESTILDLRGARPRLLRPGAILPAALAEVLGELPLAPAGGAARAPGMLPCHYAPQTPLDLIPAGEIKAEVRRRLRRAKRIAVLARAAATPPAGCVWQVAPAEPQAYARELYARLRALDTLRADHLLIEAPPATAAWEAVRDRLARAAGRGGANGNHGIAIA